MDEFARVVGIDGQACKRCEYRTIADAHDTKGHTNEDDNSHYHFLDDFQAQEQVTPSLDLQQVEINGMHGIPHRGKADYLQIRHALCPLVGHQ